MDKSSDIRVGIYGKHLYMLPKKGNVFPGHNLLTVIFKTPVNITFPFHEGYHRIPGFFVFAVTE